MKKALSAALSLLLLLSCLPASLAAAVGSPTPPSWVEKEDYLIFPGDPVYEREKWGELQALRREAENGALLPAEGRDWAAGSPGECYEIGLLRLKYAANAGDDPAAVGEALLAAGKAFSAAETGWNDQNRGKDALSARLAVEKYRAYLAYHPAYVEDWGRGIVPAIDTLAMPLEEFFDTPFMSRLSAQDRAAVEQSVYSYWSFYLEQRNLISVYLDGGVLLMDTLPQVKEQRIMVPIRAIAEALGADVEWVPDSNQVVLTRAGSTVVMTLDSTIAMVDGKPVKMDVAPYADQNRSYIPVRYVSEFFGQTVSWNQDSRRVDISEDKSAYEKTDLEAWALPMGALLTLTGGGDPTWFGGDSRAPHPDAAKTKLVEPVAVSRGLLGEDWDIGGREELLAAIKEIMAGGHNKEFLDSTEEIRGMSKYQVKQRTLLMDEVDQYMWPQTKKLWDKWGKKKGILAWDLCRVSSLAQWGYTAGYLSYGEALELIGPAAERLGETFSSWEEVYENFLDGYYWCVREDMTDMEVWDTELGMTYLALRGTVDVSPIFDDSLFEKE